MKENQNGMKMLGWGCAELVRLVREGVTSELQKGFVCSVLSTWLLVSVTCTQLSGNLVCPEYGAES